MSNDSNSKLMFAGEYRHAIDEKHRVTIPAPWRNGEGDAFYLTLGREDSHLRAMTADEFRAADARAKATLSPQDLTVFRRQFVSSAHHVQLDKQGRLLVPEEMCKKARLSGEIVLSGLTERFEIWEAKAWEETKTREKPAYDNIAFQLGL